MRYIGNKTRLLHFIRRTLRRLDVAPGTAHDAFSGTASVARALKEDGWRVAASDLMTYAHVFTRAYVVAQRPPRFTNLRAASAQVRARLQTQGARSGEAMLATVGEAIATALEPEAGFFTEQFSPAGSAGRMFFTAENAGRIDAARRALHEWRYDGAIGDDEYYLMLAALIEGADRVANTAGVYAAYIKRWQPNALRPLALTPRVPVRGKAGCTAHRADATETARVLGEIDLLYVDPPYNTRQYSGYYHVPEILARGWFGEAPVLRGKTGLLGDASLRSDWCSRRSVERAFRELLAATGARHILVSYNSEGILSGPALRRVLGEFAVGRIVRFTHAYKRYRADSDRPGRRYAGDEVRELLYYARLR
jgi:adenine-specific DNA-methyltransferase